MPRKKSRKAKSPRKNPASSRQPILIIMLFVVALVVVFNYTSSKASESTLGESTLIARGEDDNSGSSGSGSDSSGSSTNESDNSDSNSGSNTNDTSSSSGSGGSTTESLDDNDDSNIDVIQGTTLETTQIRTKSETKEDEERTEVRLSEGERIRTRTKDGLTRVDITSGGIKVRLEQREDRMIIKAEQEDGTEVELEDDTLLKIDDRLGEDGIRIATAGASRFLLQKGVAGAITNFPISIDLATNSVFVNTPQGQRMITVLPEQAIQNIIAANIVSRIGGSAILNETTNNNLTSISQLVTLGESNGIPVYEINGVSDQKLLGLIPVEIEKEITVSSETGEVIATDLSLGERIQDILSF